MSNRDFERQIANNLRERAKALSVRYKEEREIYDGIVSIALADVALAIMDAIDQERQHLIRPGGGE